MSKRPGALDLSGANKAPASMVSPGSRLHLDLPSPRVGEVPPALSPLDAFAQHSRMLARKFEESQKKGKRISRLNALEVADEIGKRPTYFRTPSNTSQHAYFGDEEEDEPLPPLPNLPIRHQTPGGDRPISHYPMMATADDDSKRNTVASDMYYDATDAPKPADNYFGIQVPRADSPEPYEQRQMPRAGDASPIVPSLTGSIDSLHSSQPRTNTDESTFHNRHDRSLAPPSSPPHLTGKKSLISIRSVMDSADEDLAPPRKFSESSQISRARSPFTPDPQLASRSPSIMSDHSAYQEEFRRPSFNFSRPLSSSGNKDFSAFRPPLSQANSFDSRPSHDIQRERSPLRQPSDSSTTSRGSERGRGRFNGYDASSQSGDESSLEVPMNGNGAPSYIYAKYSLPRGRTIDRNSVAGRNSWVHNQFKWEDGASEGASVGEPSPILPQDGFGRPGRPFKQALDIQKARSHSADGRGSTTPTRPTHRSTPSSPSIHSHSTDRTIRAHTKNSPSQEIANMTAEQHLEKGIECHSNGSLNKSTYHLRHAAKAGHPTGMLLYALACRHGWGMRANQAEGIQWLKKAVDSSSLEMIENNDQSREGAQANKSRKAQYALAIYELGMSYMNGWGTPKDKALAVRCFEIAGNWGDCDALAEAGFCYTQGLGVKKDLKKASAFYRRAADLGMSMAGNSWIYKQKYMDEPLPSPVGIKSPNPSNSDRSMKGRSRARSLFGRKKSFVNA